MWPNVIDVCVPHKKKIDKETSAGGGESISSTEQLNRNSVQNKIMCVSKELVSFKG